MAREPLNPLALFAGALAAVALARACTGDRDPAAADAPAGAELANAHEAKNALGPTAGPDISADTSAGQPAELNDFSKFSDFRAAADGAAELAHAAAVANGDTTTARDAGADGHAVTHAEPDSEPDAVHAAESWLDAVYEHGSRLCDASTATAANQG